MKNTIGAVDKHLKQLHLGDKVRLLDYDKVGTIIFEDNSISIKTHDREYSIHDFIEVDNTDHYLNYILEYVELVK